MTYDNNYIIYFYYYIPHHICDTHTPALFAYINDPVCGLCNCVICLNYR